MLENLETNALSWAHPLLRRWFAERLGSPTDAQTEGWSEILKGSSCLISAPTGSGKTLAAFLACLNELVCRACASQLENRTEVLYVSPLKALSNDIQINLQTPLAEIAKLAKQEGISMQEITVLVRTGDTLQSERRSMLKKPPHILVTTPESLYILLTAEKSRQNLAGVKTVIVDEIHAMADDKRGAHLAVSLERLERLCGNSLIRIGLSATQKPIETVARFLVGSRRELPKIVDTGHRRKIDFAVEVPGMPLQAVASNEQWQETYDRLAQLVEEHRSTLIFVNTRRMAEKLTLHLAQRLGEEAVAAHHGSLSRKMRHQAERRLKSGSLRALVATASLELGIDVGSIDLVCLINSPRSIAVALQRIGRAGHYKGAVPKGRIFPGTRDELLEAAALVNAIKEGDLDRLIIPEKPLDILAQQMVAICAAEEIAEDELYELLRKAAPYAELGKDEYLQLLAMLADGISASRGRFGAYLFWNKVEGRLKARRGARLAAITSGGAIPETALYSVLSLPEESQVGSVDEDFAVESMKGDVFLLGNSSWRIQKIETSRGRVLVEDASGASPTIPFWLGEAPGRSKELSQQIGRLRKLISDASKSGQDPELPLSLLESEYGLNRSGAEQAVEYVKEAEAVLGAVPTQELIIAERFFNEGGGMELVIHSPFGARINKAWGLALRKCFCRSFNFELQAAATDNGLNISLGEQHSFPLADVFAFLSPKSVRHVLEQAALASAIFKTRFRWDANRSLALLRFQGGRKVPPYLQRLKSDDLLAAVFPQAAACQDNIDGDIELPDHPLINEVMKDVLSEAMDIEGLTEILEGIFSGQIKCLAVDTPTPSAFSHEILNANPYAYLDDAPLEERRARAVELRRVLPENLRDLATLDPSAIAEVLEQSFPDLRDCDELHDFLQTSILLPESIVEERAQDKSESWQIYLRQLQQKQRAFRIRGQGRVFWLASERSALARNIFPDLLFLDEQSASSEQTNDAASLAEPEEAAIASAIQNMLQGWFSFMGPVSASELAGLSGLSLSQIESSLLALEASGQILRGYFRARKADIDASSISPSLSRETEWCQRRILARIHKLSLGKLRKSIEPVTQSEFMSWLLKWQHLAPGTQLNCDENGLLAVIKQLQGFEIPANAWEANILKSRLKDYDPLVLDRLCLSGQIGWAKVSPHPATLANQDEDKSRPWRVIPTSTALLSFFLRADCDWMPALHPASYDDAKGLSLEAREVKEYLKSRGASFFADIQKGTKRLPAEIENALWELVSAGLVSADGFDNLRALIDPKRRSGQGRYRTRMPRHTSGRWCLLYSEAAEKSKQLESICRVLLGRYGVVFRDLLSRESIAASWREMLLCLRLMEDRGEIRGGRFVSGFSGEQFALPEALESLRAFRSSKCINSATPGSPGSAVYVSAQDPLNLVGIIIPGKRVASNTNSFVCILNGSGDPLKTETLSLQV